MSMPYSVATLWKRTFELIALIVLSTVSATALAANETSLETSVAQLYVHRFVGSMSVVPAQSDQSHETAHNATPQPNQTSGAISGTDFEFGVYVQWLPLEHPDIDPNGLDYIHLDVSGIDANGAHINQQIIAYHDWTSTAAPHPAWWTVGAEIDTTNFQSGSILTVRATGRAHDPGWNITPSIWTFTVINSTLMSGNAQLESEAQENYRSFISNVKYELENSTFDPDISGDTLDNEQTKSDLLADVPSYTAMIVMSHGNVDEYGSIFPRFCAYNQLGHGATPARSEVTAANIARAVASKTPQQPPYTFAYFNACLVFGDIPGTDPLDKRMASALLEGNTAATLPSSGNSLDQDRAVVGYQYTIQTWPQTERFGWLMMRNLTKHYRPVQKAIDYAYRVAAPVVLVSGAGRANAEPTILGDKSMTLHGIYGNPINPRTGQQYVGDAKTYVWFWQDLDKVYIGAE